MSARTHMLKCTCIPTFPVNKVLPQNKTKIKPITPWAQEPHILYEAFFPHCFKVVPLQVWSLDQCHQHHLET